MAKEAVLSFRIPGEIKAGLEREAAADDRSVSGLVERILRDWLQQRGALRPPTKVVNPARVRAKMKMLEPRVKILDPDITKREK